MSQQNERISENPKSFQEVYEKLMDVMESVKSGTMSVDEGEVIAKAGFGASKVIESDLHARMFAAKIETRGPRAVGVKDAANQIAAN